MANEVVDMLAVYYFFFFFKYSLSTDDEPFQLSHLLTPSAAE